MPLANAFLSGLLTTWQKCVPIVRVMAVFMSGKRCLEYLHQFDHVKANDWPSSVTLST